MIKVSYTVSLICILRALQHLRWRHRAQKWFRDIWPKLNFNRQLRVTHHNNWETRKKMFTYGKVLANRSFFQLDFGIIFLFTVRIPINFLNLTDTFIIDILYLFSALKTEHRKNKKSLTTRWNPMSTEFQRMMRPEFPLIECLSDDLFIG